MNYSDELTAAMKWLGEKQDTYFLGQSVGCPGTAMFTTLQGVPEEKRLELPVIEDAQMGMSTGLALSGFVPITIFPRWNFLLLATNQLVLHLNKLSEYSDYRVKVIIRTAVASRTPLDPQAQHYGNFSDSFIRMLKSVEVIQLTAPKDIGPAYRHAYNRPDGKSTLLVEFTEMYA